MFKAVLRTITLTISAVSIHAASLPDFTKYDQFSERKQRFIAYLLPLAQAANKEVLQDRTKLLALQSQKSGNLGLLNVRWLNTKCAEYNVKSCDLTQDRTWSELLTKIDIVPNSLILAQAGTESGWGTSRFAREGNNLFGQWCFSNNCSIVAHPDHTTTGPGLRKFNSPQTAVKAYLLNINAGKSYTKLREIRQELHAKDQSLSSTSLANGLMLYSTRGQAYIDQIKGIIAANKLAVYDVI